MTSQVDASELLMENSTTLGCKLRPAVLVSFLFLAQLSKVDPKTLRKRNPNTRTLRKQLEGVPCRENKRSGM